MHKLFCGMYSSPVRGENAEGCQSFAPGAVGHKIANDFAFDGLLFFYVLKSPGAEVHAFRRGDGSKNAGGKDLSVGPVYDVDVAVAIRMNDDFFVLSVDRQIQQYIFVHAVVIVEIVRAVLIEPNRFPSVGVTRENSGGPFVIAGAGIGIPRPGICRAVKNQVQLSGRKRSSPRLRRRQCARHRAARFLLPGLGRDRSDNRV